MITRMDIKAYFARTVRRWAGFTRSGVLASARRLRTGPLPSFTTRLGFGLLGSALVGIGVAFLIAADLGVAPYDVLLSALAVHLPISHGQAAWALAAVLFSIAAVLGQRPGPLAAVYVVANGFAVDWAIGVVDAPEQLPARVLMALVGYAVLVAGIGMIVHSSATGGPFDALMRAAEDRGANPSHVRTGLEVAAVTGGAIAGGALGPGTVVVALTIGPAILKTMTAIDDHSIGRQVRRHEASELERRVPIGAPR